MGLLAAAERVAPASTRTVFPAASAKAPQQPAENAIDLVIDALPFTVKGRTGSAIAVNGTVPGPLVRLREGQEAVLRVDNRLKEATSIHWHGLLLPPDMDGVPSVSFGGIPPESSFTYRFPVKQSGTYWAHSHSGGQELLGLYFPLIIDPIKPEPFQYDRDYVVMLSDWSFESPVKIMSNLKKQAGYYNFQKRTTGDLIRDIRKNGLSATAKERLSFSKMRMDATDFADVTGYTYTYLMNGLTPDANWTGLFTPGEKVRLRFIDAGAMTYFDIRIPGLQMTVVQVDGQNVAPVPVSEFRIGPGETYDVIVQPGEQAYTLFAESMDRSGFTRGTLAPRAGLSAPIPPRRPRPIRTMTDMGMGSMAGMAGMAGEKASDLPKPGMSEMEMPGREMGGTKAKAASTMPGMDITGRQSHDMGTVEKVRARTTELFHRMNDGTRMPGPAMNSAAKQDPMAGMNMGKGGLKGKGTLQGPNPPGSASVMHGPDTHGRGNSSIAMSESSRLNDPGSGFEEATGKVLVYSDLKSLTPQYDARPPQREIELHLTGNMERYIWGFDGKKYSEAKTPIAFDYGERLRLILVNDTMMEHPIHLHGMWMEIENGHGAYQPRKHTVSVKPAERLTVAITADAPGQWVLHCHLLLHMEMGMLRVVEVSPEVKA